MAIYPLDFPLSKLDKQILSLISKLLLQRFDSSGIGSNLSEDIVPLSDSEAKRLLNLLNKLLESRGFREAAYFVESMTEPVEKNEESLRELYLSSRKRKGRTRVAASWHWSDFQIRFGIRKSYKHSSGVQPMDFDHFRKMEEKLYHELGIDSRIINLILKTLRAQQASLSNIRNTKQSLKPGSIRNAILKPFQGLVSNGQKKPFTGEISREKLSALYIIVADLSALFTTRDWSVAGTLSMIAGSIAILGSNTGSD